MRSAILAVAALLAAGCGTEDSPERAAQEPGEPPPAAELVCGEPGPELLTPTIRAQPDGVHVRVRNETDHAVELDYEITRGDTGGGGSMAGPGTSDHVLPFDAEEVSLGCSPEALDREDLRVVDPGEELQSAQLDCEEYSADTPTPPKSLKGGDPVAVATRFLRGRGLRPTDKVERALPIADEFQTVRVVRDGRPVAAVWFDNPEAPHGIGTVEMCTDFAE